VQRLLEPLQLGELNLPHRIAMSAMTRNRSPGETPNAMNALYYAQRASAAFIVSESTAISQEGLGWPGTPGIFTAQQVAGWRGVTDAVHARGGYIFLQMWHCGAASHPRHPRRRAAPGPVAHHPGRHRAHAAGPCAPGRLARHDHSRNREDGRRLRHRRAPCDGRGF
jgi:N-ethylmaleimide reductase